jgi:hypothetical protein
MLFCLHLSFFFPSSSSWLGAFGVDAGLTRASPLDSQLAVAESREKVERRGPSARPPPTAPLIVFQGQSSALASKRVLEWAQIAVARVNLACCKSVLLCVLRYGGEAMNYRRLVQALYAMRLGRVQFFRTGELSMKLPFPSNSSTV